MLKEQGYAVQQGVLTFRDKQSFTDLLDKLKDKTSEQLNDWESQMGFKSLRALHEEAVAKEEVFLQEIAEKNPGNTTLTRRELGYTKFTTDFIRKGLFNVNEFETFDINVTAPHYAKIVNRDGVFRIGNSIIMPQNHMIKILKGGDVSKISMLRDATNSDDTKGIQINEIEKNSFKKSETETGRANAWTYCDTNANGYRLIVYEESYEGNTYPDEIPCYGAEAAYWLRFRSLKKVLGTWQNHNTSLWYTVSSVKIEQWKVCNFPIQCGPTTVVQSYLSTPVNVSEARYDIPYGNDQSIYFLTGYELGPCGTGGFNTCTSPDGFCTSDPLGKLFYITRSHEVYGKGGTYCHVGE